MWYVKEEILKRFRIHFIPVCCILIRCKNWWIIHWCSWDAFDLIFFQRHFFFFLYICHLLWHYSFFTVSSKRKIKWKKYKKHAGIRSKMDDDDNDDGIVVVIEISYYIKWWCNCNAMLFFCMAPGTRPISLFLSLLTSDYWLTDWWALYTQCGGNNEYNKRCNHFNYFMSCCSLALPPHV